MYPCFIESSSTSVNVVVKPSWTAAGEVSFLLLYSLELQHMSQFGGLPACRKTPLLSEEYEHQEQSKIVELESFQPQD